MNKIIVIVGPTGVGKTRLSLELAKKYDGEIINADSTQVFKGLDIATAKIKDKEGVVHHLIDIKNIDEDYTVYNFQIDCRTAINDILARGRTPIIVGGTGLYIKAALFNYEFEEETILNNNYDEYSNEQLYKKLMEIDVNSSIHPNNRKRLIRAINYYEINGVPMSLKREANKELYDSIYIGLTTDRETLYNRINNRVDEMVKEGLLDEAKKIYDSGIRTKAIMTPIGYKELFPYFEGNKSLEECLDLIKQNSRRYAKRQYTWFNNQMNIEWFDVDFDNFSSTVNKITKYIDKKKDIKN